LRLVEKRKGSSWGGSEPGGRYYSTTSGRGERKGERLSLLMLPEKKNGIKGM